MEHDPEETIEPPVPAGLGEVTDAQRALMELYGLSDALIAAAAHDIPVLVNQDKLRNPHAQWLQSQSPTTKDAWLARLMSDPPSTVASEIQAENPNLRVLISELRREGFLTK